MSTAPTLCPQISPAANAPQSMALIWVTEDENAEIHGKTLDLQQSSLSSAITQMQSIALDNSFRMGRIVKEDGEVLADVIMGGKVIH